jgi:hypothetical protein
MAWSRFLRFPLLAAALCTTAAGCGSSSSSLATGDGARLHRDVASIRVAASGHDPAAAHAAVRTLEADVAQLRTAGKLAPADASVLMADAGQVDRRVTIEVHAPAALAPATTTSPPARPVAPASPAKPHPAPAHGPHGKGKGKDKGKGHGGD